MRTRGILAVLAVLVGAMASGTSPAAAATLPKGTVELTPSLNFSHVGFSFDGNDAGSLTTLLASGLIGYCITDRVELGGGLLVNHQSFDDPAFGSESATSLGVTAGAQLNFSTAGRTIPFARAAIGVLTNSGDLSSGEETTFIAPILQAGIRLLVGSAASVNFGLGYQHHSSALGVSDLSSNTFGLEVGVSIFPRMGP